VKVKNLAKKVNQTLTVILLPSFQKKLEKINKAHLKIILKLIKKLERMGKNALKILDVEEYYLLCEMKVMRPPYRLYVIVNQKTNEYYIAEWEHKEKQNKVIGELKHKLSLAVEVGLEKIFT
jgi:mRNA-degrading endonuclease RelE of RelBE toxin-antitoxin system